MASYFTAKLCTSSTVFAASAFSAPPCSLASPGEQPKRSLKARPNVFSFANPVEYPISAILSRARFGSTNRRIASSNRRPLIKLATPPCSRNNISSYRGGARNSQNALWTLSAVKSGPAARFDVRERLRSQSRRQAAILSIIGLCAACGSRHAASRSSVACPATRDCSTVMSVRTRASV